MTAALARARETTRAHDLLLAAFLIYTFVGLHPLAEVSTPARVDGSVADRVAVLGQFGLALYVLRENFARACACLFANPGQIALVGLALLSALWSDFPDLTLRRALLLVLLTTIVWALAAGVSDLSRFHGQVFAVLTLVAAVNLAAAALVPARAVSDIGVNGLYAQKNVAGTVAMIGAVLGFGWLLGASRPREVAKGALALALILVFLLATRSKTSIALTGLGLAAMAFFALAERLGPRFLMGAMALSLLMLAALLAAFAAMDFDLAAALDYMLPDASFTGRDQLWAFTFREAQKAYWGGHGYGAFWDVGFRDDPVLRAETGTWLSTTPVGVINQAHNGYIELWLELGLPAAVLAGLTILKGAGVGAARALFGAASRQDRAALGAFAMLLGLHLLHNLTEATLFIRGMSFSSMAALALFLVALPPRRPCD